MYGDYKSVQNNKRKIGEEGELIVLDKYLQDGYTLVERNFCFRGGEIDIIVRDKNTIVFVEVKTVNRVQNLHDYITPKKMFHLRKSAETFLRKNKTSLQPRFDFAFVKGKDIIQIYQNVEM